MKSFCLLSEAYNDDQFTQCASIPFSEIRPAINNKYLGDFAIDYYFNPGYAIKKRIVFEKLLLIDYGSPLDILCKI